ncbi:MAG: divalent-cation tolerance protein CutA [Candidatus Eiseniibacteriota bacterium]
MNARLVLTTCADRATAESLGRTLVEERLAACVNVLPGIRSIYRWHGQIEAAEECLLLVKTSRERYDAAAARLIELHPYQVPELLAFDVADGSAAYLGWLAASVDPRGA